MIGCVRACPIRSNPSAIRIVIDEHHQSSENSLAIDVRELLDVSSNPPSPDRTHDRKESLSERRDMLIESYRSSVHALRESSATCASPSSFFNLSLAMERDSITCSTLLRGELLLPSVHLSLTPINPLRLSSSPLVQTLLDNPAPFTSQPALASGFVTLNEVRQIVPLLESDPFAYQCPLIGIWFIDQDTTKPSASPSSKARSSLFSLDFWASCLRFLYSQRIKDRVTVAPFTFMVVRFAPPGRASHHPAYECFECNAKIIGAALTLNSFTERVYDSMLDDTPSREFAFEAECDRTHYRAFARALRNPDSPVSSLPPTPIKARKRNRQSVSNKRDTRTNVYSGGIVSRIASTSAAAAAAADIYMPQSPPSPQSPRSSRSPSSPSSSSSSSSSSPSSSAMHSPLIHRPVYHHVSSHNRQRPDRQLVLASSVRELLHDYVHRSEFEEQAKELASIRQRLALVMSWLSSRKALPLDTQSTDEVHTARMQAQFDADIRVSVVREDPVPTPVPHSFENEHDSASTPTDEETQQYNVQDTKDNLHFDHTSIDISRQYDDDNVSIASLDADLLEDKYLGDYSEPSSGASTPIRSSASPGRKPYMMQLPSDLQFLIVKR
jgi:SCL-interrupting locus protein N-terminus